MSTVKYTNDHEWIKVEGDTAWIGITTYARHALGDLVYLELPENGRQIKKGDNFAVVESVKAASEIYTPVTGEIVAVNDALTSAPEQVNSDPHAAWIIKVRPSNAADLDALLDADAYTQHVG